MFNRNEAIELIRSTIIETMGCTEPAAIALAVSTAFKVSDKANIKKVDVILDRNTYKNASSAGIPGTGGEGIDLAVALALTSIDPSKKLLVFDDITNEDVAKANEFISSGIIHISCDREIRGLYIKAKIITEEGYATAIIKGHHSNLIFIEKDGEILVEKEAESNSKKNFSCDDISVENLLSIVDEIPDSELSFLNKCVEVNLKAANDTLKNASENNLGIVLESLMKKGILANDQIGKMKSLAAAAATARMSGKQLPIMGCGGSGNLGITFFTAVGMSYKQFNMTKPLHRALALGALLVVVIKKMTGLLAPVCGCIVAGGSASAAAITYALGGTNEQILSAMNLVLCSLAGTFCDGAKPSCAAKISTAVGVAVESALLAIENMTYCGQGILSKTLEETLDNLKTLHDHGMQNVDDAIVSILETGSKSNKLSMLLKHA